MIMLSNAQNNINKVFATGANNLSSKYDKNDWLLAEKKVPDFDRKVLECIKLLGKNGGKNVEYSLDDYYSTGDEIYDSCRKLINEKFPLAPNKSEYVNDTQQSKSKKKTKFKNNNPNKMNKTEIILHNTKISVTNKISDAIDSFSEKEFRPQIAFNDSIVEVKGIGLLYAGWFLEKHQNKYKKIKNLPFSLGVIVAIQKFINTCEQFLCITLIKSNEKIYVAKQLIIDLKYWLTKLTNIYPYNGFIICDYAPELLVYTDHDKAIPKIGIKPRKHQHDLMKEVIANFNKGFILTYNPMIGLGKTTFSIGIASYIESLRYNAQYSNLQLIFACNLAPVKNQVLNMCYNAGIKFGHGYRNVNTGEYKIVNHNNTTNENRIVIVSSPEIAYDILNDNKDNNTLGKPANRYVLFLDEPTIGADIAGCNVLRENVALMTVQPKWTIWSSATFPDIDKISPILDAQKQKYPDIHIGCVESNEIQIGCDVKTFNNTYIMPHLGLTSTNELKTVYNVIIKCPFLGRIYTSRVGKSLYNKMTKCNVPNVPNIEESFSNIDNLSSDKVRQTAMKMLYILSDTTDEIVTEVCSSIITDKVKLDIADEPESTTKSNYIDDGFEWEEEESTDDVPENSVDYDKMGTIQAYRFLNMSIIATPTPTQFANTHFKHLLNDIKSAPVDKSKSVNDCPVAVKNFKNLHRIYEQEMTAYDKLKAFTEKNTKDEEKLSQILQEMKKPVLKFPDFAQINTVSHIKHYAKSHVKSIVSRFVRSSLCIDDLNVDEFTVDDDIILLLLSGIGIYSSTFHDQIYSKKVLELASEGRLAYIISDSSICYGANYPVNRVFITEDFARLHSIYTLYQLMGRAGRVGKSWIAEAYVTDSVALRIINFTRNNSESNIESDNMNKMFVQLEHDKREQLFQRINNLEQTLNPQKSKPVTNITVVNTSKCDNNNEDNNNEDITDVENDIINASNQVSSNRIQISAVIYNEMTNEATGERVQNVDELNWRHFNYTDDHNNSITNTDFDETISSSITDPVTHITTTNQIHIHDHVDNNVVNNSTARHVSLKDDSNRFGALVEDDVSDIPSDNYSKNSTNNRNFTNNKNHKYDKFGLLMDSNISNDSNNSNDSSNRPVKRFDKPDNSTGETSWRQKPSTKKYTPPVFRNKNKKN